jgi:hypothetical protein
VKTTEYAAVTAVHSVDPDRWQTEFSAVIDRIAPRFRRYEPLRHAAELMAGMVSGLDRKNCWTIAEHRGAATPDGLQHLLARASWDADDVRDDLRDYVVDAFGDPGASLVGLDQHQVRRWNSWHRWTTLAMLAHAFLAVATAIERDTTPTPTGLITLTVNEFRRLFDALLLATRQTVASLLAWSQWAPTTPISSTPIPLPTTPESMNPIYGCSIS